MIQNKAIFILTHLVLIFYHIFQADAKKWMSEREDLEKTIAEKTKLVKDNSTTCDKLQREVEQLKQQVMKMK